MNMLWTDVCLGVREPGAPRIVLNLGWRKEVGGGDEGSRLWE